MASGDTKSAEEVQVGDQLLGDDGRPRVVMRLHRGRQEMACVTPVKGASFVVNLGHILSLVDTQTGAVVDLSVSDWMGRSNTFKHCHKLYRVGVESFRRHQEQMPIHPWLLGVMLGDGSLGLSLVVTNPNAAIQSRVLELAGCAGVDADVRQYGDSCPSIHLSNDRGIGNPLLQAIRSLGLQGKTAHGKFIPDAYKFAPVIARRALLAGLLDTDGHLASGSYDWISASEALADDVVFVARSLGLAAYKRACEKYCQTGAGGTYYRVSISGDFTAIPTVKHMPTARLQKKSVLRTGFSVEVLPEADYYGWEVDGNNRYLMGDFTVTHNSGKTEIGMALVKGAQAKHKRVAFLCNRVHLVEQTSRRFAKSGIRHGIIQGSNTTRVYENVLVASIQTVAKRGLPPVDLIIIDEAHSVAGSKEYRAVIAAAKGAPVIGLSATPYARGLGKHYDELGGALFQQMIIAATIPELIADGYLVDCDVYAPSEPDMAGIKQTRNSFGEMDYTDADVGRATDKPELIGDIVTHWMRLAKGTATVCFASNIAHSKHIVERFRAAGVAAEHIDCYTDEADRQAILRRIETGETTVISNVGILAEGWDFPACKTLILARPTRSLIRYIQMAGRVLRPHETKERALILDHSGTVTRLGFPTDEFPLELDDGKPKDVAAAPREREAPLPKACPSCSYVKTVHKCPVCGFAPEHKADVNVKDGELILLTKKPKASKMDKQAFYSQLIAIAESKGYREGWISHKYREYFGVWPRGLDDVAAEPTQEVHNFLKYLQIRNAKAKEAQHAGA